MTVRAHASSPADDIPASHDPARNQPRIDHTHHASTVSTASTASTFDAPAAQKPRTDLSHTLSPQNGHSGAQTCDEEESLRRAQTTQPPTSFRHVIIALAFLCNACLYLNRANFSTAVLYMYADDLGAQSRALSAFYFGYPVFQIGGGLLATRFGGKRVLSIAVFTWSLATILVVPAYSVDSAASSADTAIRVALVFACRVVIGIAEGVNYPSQTRLITEWIPRDELSLAYGWTFAGESAGTIAAMFACPYIAALMGWQAIMYGCAGVGFVWLVAFTLLAQISPEVCFENQIFQLLSKEELDYIVRNRGEMAADEGGIIMSDESDVGIERLSLSASIAGESRSSARALLRNDSISSGSTHSDDRGGSISSEVSMSTSAPEDASQPAHEVRLEAGVAIVASPNRRSAATRLTGRSSAARPAEVRTEGSSSDVDTSVPHTPPPPRRSTGWADAEVDPPLPWLAFATSPAYLATIATNFCTNWSIYLMLSVLPDYFKTKFHVDYRKISLYFCGPDKHVV